MSQGTSFIMQQQITYEPTYMYMYIVHALRKRFEDNSKEIDHICVLLQEGFRDIRDLGIICSYNARVPDAWSLICRNNH